MKKKVQFHSGKVNKTLVAEVLEERKTNYLLKLPDGNVIKKKKTQVELITD